MRPVRFERNFLAYPAGSCLATFGETKVVCTASIEAGVPAFLQDAGQGWITAEYAMLPGSTAGGRKRRNGAHRDGRGVEIQRLIGRSLRAAVDLTKLGPVSIVIDCDVLQADGGTRTAAISGGWVALHDGLCRLARDQGLESPERYLIGQVAAVSVGIVDGRVVCDLSYDQDSRALVDMNVVKREGDYIEIQGTGERGPFSRADLVRLLDAAEEGFERIFPAQRRALEQV